MTSAPAAGRRWWIGAAAATALGATLAASSASVWRAPDAAQVDVWLHLAADGRDPHAEADLRRWSGRGNRDARRAFIQLLSHRHDAASEQPLTEALATAADDGDPWAATQLANRALREIGALAVPASEARIRQISRWYEQGAAAGLPEAARMRGVLLAEGKAEPPNPVAARAWFQRAADGGDAQAMFLLANAYRSGEGGGRDDTQALRWYRRAADADFAPALQTLALAYRHGELGLPVDGAQERLLDHEAAEALTHAPRIGG